MVDDSTSIIWVADNLWDQHSLPPDRNILTTWAWCNTDWQSSSSADKFECNYAGHVQNQY